MKINSEIDVSIKKDDDGWYDLYFNDYYVDDAAIALGIIKDCLDGKSTIAEYNWAYGYLCGIEKATDILRAERTKIIEEDKLKNGSR